MVGERRAVSKPPSAPPPPLVACFFVQVKSCLDVTMYAAVERGVFLPGTVVQVSAALCTAAPGAYSTEG